MHPPHFQENPMIAEKQTLSTADRDEIISHVEHCLNVFTRKDRLLTAAELQLKAMLSTVLHQLGADNRDASKHPFSDL
jgi:hypothetical protein